MWPFTRKRKVRLEEFCEQFYHQHILDPVGPRGIDVHGAYMDVVKRSVADADERFSWVNCDDLRFEMTAIRFEVFGLAWLDQFGPRHTPAVSAFTKEYLTGRNRCEIWDAMGEYNQAIARSANGLVRLYGTRGGRAFSTFVNQMRADWADAWLDNGFEPDVVGRAANRVGTVWKRRVAPGFIAARLCERLGSELNEEATFRLMAVIHGYYRGSRQELKRIRVTWSGADPGETPAKPVPDSGEASSDSGTTSLQTEEHVRQEIGRLRRELDLLEHPNTLYQFGLSSLDGDDVPQNSVAAANWFRSAADNGHANAQHSLALMYERGQGVPQDVVQAERWYRMAAEQGHAGSQNNLGRLYEQGNGVAKDCEAAAAWYRRAAASGDPNGAANLKRLEIARKRDEYASIVSEFADSIADRPPLIGDCAQLPRPKAAILYAARWMMDDYEAQCKAAADEEIRKKYEQVLQTFGYLFTHLARDWHDIDPQDKGAIIKLKGYDAWPEWALALKEKYINEDRAREEAFDIAHEVMVDRVVRPPSGSP